MDWCRVAEARDELHRMLNEDELRNAVLLVFANKQDLPNAMTAAELTVGSCCRYYCSSPNCLHQEKLGLQSLRQRTWYIQGTCATSGDFSFRSSVLSSPSFLPTHPLFLLVIPEILLCCCNRRRPLRGARLALQRAFQSEMSRR
eukprot:746030-Hanusia_phi.AAC.2